MPRPARIGPASLFEGENLRAQELEDRWNPRPEFRPEDTDGIVEDSPFKKHVKSLGGIVERVRNSSLGQSRLGQAFGDTIGQVGDAWEALNGPDRGPAFKNAVVPDAPGQRFGNFAKVGASEAKKIAGNVRPSAFRGVGNDTALDAIKELRSVGGTTDAIEDLGRGAHPDVVRRIANRGASEQPVGGVAGDTTVKGKLHNIRQFRLQRPPTPEVSPAPAAPAVHIPVEHQSAPSARVVHARDHLRSLGIDTDVARAAVPRQGARAAEFERGASGLYVPRDAGELSTDIKSLFGDETPIIKDMTDKNGISPNHLMTRPSDGKMFMRKGAAHSSNFGGDLTGEARDVSATSLAHGMHPRTVESKVLKEGGSVQGMVDDKPFGTYKTVAHDPNFQMNEGHVKSLSEEEIIDYLIQNADNHQNQFLIAPDAVIGIDKGLGTVERARSLNPTPSTIFDMGRAQRSVYSKQIHKGARGNSMVNPQWAHDFIENTVKKQTDEGIMRSMKPVFDAKKSPDADRAGWLHNYRGRIASLHDNWSKYQDKYYKP
jgi:hypothetical protein